MSSGACSRTARSVVVTPLTFSKSLSVKIATRITQHSNGNRETRLSTDCRRNVTWTGHTVARCRAATMPRSGHGATYGVRRQGKKCWCRSTVDEQRLSDLDAAALAKPGAQIESFGRNHDNRRPVTEVPHLLASRERRGAREPARPAILEVQRGVHEIKMDAGNKDRRDRHEHNRFGGVPERQ